jgi:hypothetical protein
MLGTFYRSPELPVKLFNLDFSNPVGVAAGMDKNGAAVPSWQSIGYGFCEIGGVTLHEQPGNPKPRMIKALSLLALNILGFGFPGCSWRVTPPISQKPYPIDCHEGTAAPFLSMPAATPTGFEKSRLNNFTGSSGER